MSDKYFVPPHMPENWNGVLIVGDCPSQPDVNKGIPFRGGYGLELQKLLAGAGIQLKECATTYAYKEVPREGDMKSCYLTKSKVKTGEAVEFRGKFIPPLFASYVEDVREEVRRSGAKVVVTLGEAALLAVLGESGIDDFRGSQEYFEGGDIPVLPTHSPARVMKQVQLRYLVARDFQRVAGVMERGRWDDPDWKIVINPTFLQCYTTLTSFLLKLDAGEIMHLGVDIETRRRFYIGVLGFAWSAKNALVIPFIKPDWTPYWEDPTAEFTLVALCKQVLEHPNVRVSGQNYHYDAQYMARHWGVRSHIWCDTMIAHHCCFVADIPKALHVISSIYCDYHQYWKDEAQGTGEDKWEPTSEGWDNYLLYNGKDCCKTWDAAEVLMNNALPAMGMEKAWEFQMGMWQNLLKVMLRGNSYDWDERWVQRRELEEDLNQLETFMYAIIPPEIYPRVGDVPFFKSHTKLRDLFYNVLNVPVVTKKNAKKDYTATTDEAALNVIMKREPLLRPLCEAIQTYRSMRVFLDNFLTGKPDYDDYIRSMYGLAGTCTLRLSSRGDVFDFGLNLQNLPKGDG